MEMFIYILNVFVDIKNEIDNKIKYGGIWRFQPSGEEKSLQS